ncbi:MAG: Hsp20/alpha crystallin family protein [Pseudomonadota bacterium]
MAETKDLKVKEKHEVINPAEYTQEGLVFTPAVDIFETEREITLLADMPGVTGENITIDLHEGVLTISGDVKPWEEPDESVLMIEFQIGKYYRQFTLSEVIDQNKIEARIEDGVLRLVLPKAEKAMPRKIMVTS